MQNGVTCASQRRLVTLLRGEIRAPKHQENRFWNCLLNDPTLRPLGRKSNLCEKVMQAVCEDKRANPYTSASGVWEGETVILMSFCLYWKVFSRAVSCGRKLFLKINCLKAPPHLICIHFGFPQAPSRSVFQIW